MPDKEVILTLEGLKKLEAELELLKTVKRREVAERIKQAIEFEDAKNEQAFIEGRILTVEKTLRHARVIDDAEIVTDVVSVGSKVLLKDLTCGEEIKFTIVGSAEADPRAQKLSTESPVGQAILGQSIGHVAEVKVPAGCLQYKIMDICR